MIAPKSGYRGEALMERDRSRMPKTIGGLLAWFAKEWDAEVPIRLHTVEVYNARQERDKDGGKLWSAGLVGGSGLGAHAFTDQFRRYMESPAGELDMDGSYVRPMHAAVRRIEIRDGEMGGNLRAVARAGYDWRSVADRGHWTHDMYQVYIEEALRRLWREYAAQRLRLA